MASLNGKLYCKNINEFKKILPYFIHKDNRGVLHFSFNTIIVNTKENSYKKIYQTLGVLDQHKTANSIITAILKDYKEIVFKKSKGKIKLKNDDLIFIINNS